MMNNSHPDPPDDGPSDPPSDPPVFRTPEEVLRHMGHNIRALREAKGLSQYELADAVGVARATIANMEAGSQNTSVKRLVRIANVLDVEPKELVALYIVERVNETEQK